MAVFSHSFTRAHSSTNFQQGESSAIYSHLRFPPKLQQLSRLSHIDRGSSCTFFTQKKLLRLSGWGTLYRRAPGRIECPNFPLAETDWFPLPETDLGPDLTTPDESEGDTMRIRKLRSSCTTSEQQLSTSHSHPPSILHFCAPRGRHPATAAPEQKRTPVNKNANHNESTEKC